ncbi:hypothetical protein [Morganella morganii]|uniref:hypothetical protein n=1 Tax=Morganella morganii TaxID=582 RepID=UPI002809E093|nr:hypothetical protein SUGSMm_15220 [Morganella morganii subsp. sibonii]HDU8310031.1 hypothetical protein [Morganella morganii subsp. sibonii]
MKKIGDVTSTADKNGEWTNGNVAAGIAPTILEAGWLNSVQREILGVLIKAGIQQDKNNDTQLAEAISTIISGGNYATTEDLKKYLAKDQNGADIPNKDTFIKNLGLPEKFQPKGNYQPAGNYADGNTFKKNIDNASVTSPAGKYSLIIDNDGKFFTWDGKNATVSFSATGVMEAGYIPYARVTGAPAHLGVGQSWNNMTSSRSVGVTYTNDTGKPIQLCVYYGVTGAGDWGASLIVNGIETGGSNGGFNCIIPAGTVYRLDVSGTARLSRWLELR